ncbi:MAG TPA: fibronectin type III domain-containing protein [Vicinamibacterales bacterium]|nr:fibronectin type III domain-containing protein [Vicinamibacterales bacterium]
MMSFGSGRWAVAVLAVSVCLGFAAPALAQRAWSVPLDLTPGGQQARRPRLAMDDNGHALATWIREQGTARVTQSSRLTGGSLIWTLPANISAPSTEAALEGTDIALNGSGDGVAAWVHREPGSDPARQRIQAARYDGVAAAWGTPVNLSAPVETAVHPRVGLDAAGNALVIWVASGPTTRVVQGARYDAAAGEWSALVTLSVDGGDIAGEPALSMDDAGDGVAVWARGNGSATIVQASAYDGASGAWSAPVDLSAVGYPASDPHVSRARTGVAAVAVWKRSNGTTQQIESSRLDPGPGTWSDPVTLSYAGADAFESDVIADEDGNALAAWTRFDGNFRSLQTARYSVSAAAWSPAANRTAGGNVQGPNLSMDAAGNAALIWTRSNGAHDVVQAAFFDAALDGWSATNDLSQPFATARAPRVRLDSTGDAVAVWQLDADYQIVQASVFTISTAPRLQPAGVAGPFITLSWTPPTSGVPPSAYTIVASAAPGGAPVASLPVGLLVSTTVMAPDGVYYVRVMATVGTGEVPSNEITVVVGFGPTPTEPLNFVATVEASAVTLTWTPPLNAAIAPVQTYVVEAGSEPGLANLAWFATGNAFTTYEAPGVPNGRYWVRVRAQSAGGLSLPSIEARVVIGLPPPGAPALVLTSVTGATVTLDWTEAPAPGAPVSGYQVRAGTAPGLSNAAVVDLAPSDRRYVASVVPTGTYYVRVVPLSAQGPGDTSNEVVVTVP